MIQPKYTNDLAQHSDSHVWISWQMLYCKKLHKKTLRKRKIWNKKQAVHIKFNLFVTLSIIILVLMVQLLIKLMRFPTNGQAITHLLLNLKSNAQTLFKLSFRKNWTRKRLMRLFLSLKNNLRRNCLAPLSEC